MGKIFKKIGKCCKTALAKTFDDWFKAQFKRTMKSLAKSIILTMIGDWIEDKIIEPCLREMNYIYDEYNLPRRYDIEDFEF